MLTTRSAVVGGLQSRAGSRQAPGLAARSTGRPGSSIARRVAAPQKEEQAVDVDNAERARLEASDAFAELVAINNKKQSVNKPQKVRAELFAHESGPAGANTDQRSAVL